MSAGEPTRRLSYFQGSPSKGEGLTASFDILNRVTALGSVSNTWGGNSLRASRTTSGGTTYFLYDGSSPVCELSSTSAVTATNTFGGAGLISRHTSGGSTFYTFDEQGDVTQRYTSTGNLVSSDLYDAFGKGTSTGGGDVFGYEGQAGYYTDMEIREPSRQTLRNDRKNKAMTITINAPAEVEAAIMERAARAGLSVSEYALRALATGSPAANAVRKPGDAQATRREKSRQEAKARLEARFAAGAYKNLSVNAFLAERAEETRREEERAGAGPAPSLSDPVTP